MDSIKEISVIVPVYNGARALSELVTRIVDVLEKIKISYEIIIVDDFSTDNSWDVLVEIQQKYIDVSIIRLSKNFGQHNATVCGISESSGNTIITLDDDLEHPPEFIEELYTHFVEGGYDLYYAIPKNRQKNIIRNFISELWYFSTKISKKGIGKATSYRVMKKKLAQCLIQHREPFVYIESILHWYTENIGYLEVEFDKRKYGNSNYSILSLFTLNHDIGMHYDTHILKFMKNFGAIVFFASMALIFRFLIRKIYGHVIPGYTSIIIVLLFSTGTLFWGMGYLGLYIGKMFRILNKEPQFQITEKKTSRKK